MSDWLYDLSLGWMAVVIFARTYVIAALVYALVEGLAVDARGRAFKALSPGMLPPLGIIFGLLVGFIAAQVWSDFERARVAVANEASALRGVMLLAKNFSAEDEAQLRTLVSRHIEDAVGHEWPAMARQSATLDKISVPLTEALERALALKPETEGQRTAQREIAAAVERALDARRQRVIISQSSVNAVKWSGLLLQALCTLVAIAMVHSDNRLASAIALALFSTGIALSVVLIAAHNRPFAGEVSVSPEPLKEVIPNAAPMVSSPP